MQPTTTFFVVCGIRAVIFLLALFVIYKLVKYAVKNGIKEARREREQEESSRWEKEED